MGLSPFFVWSHVLSASAGTRLAPARSSRQCLRRAAVLAVLRRMLRAFLRVTARLVLVLSSWGSLEEVRAHLKNLVVCHIQQTETAACDSRIKTKDKIRPGYVHGCSSVSSTMESSIWVDQSLIDAPHARRAEQTASGITPPAKPCGHCCAPPLAAWAHCRRFSTLCASACASGEKCAPPDGPPATLTPYVCSLPPAGGPADRRRHGR